ncbi:MAG: HD domain-containing protein [Burkholderiaceae bacterium]
MDKNGIVTLFAMHGMRHYSGERAEAVTALEHSLQCATLAQQDGASAGLILAALLHDIGHMTRRSESIRDDVDDLHELIGARMLSRELPPSVTEPVRLHVAAKRYLCAVDPAYMAGLSPASVHSLSLQGGPMSGAEIERYKGEAYAEDGLRLRRWDDLAKTPGRATPPLEHFLALLGCVR